MKSAIAIGPNPDFTIAAVPPPPRSGIAGWVAGVVARFHCYRRLRRERDQLLSLGERDLHDIGISRVDAVRIANRSTWDACRAPASHDPHLRSPQL